MRVCRARVRESARGSGQLEEVALGAVGLIVLFVEKARFVVEFRHFAAFPIVVKFSGSFCLVEVLFRLAK